MTRKLHRRSATKWLLLACLLSAGSAGASSHRSRHAEAVKHFRAADVAFLAGRYAEALRELERAYELEPRPELLISMGQAHRRLGHLDEAIERLDRYLAVSRDDIQRVAARYFTPTNRTVLDVVPATVGGGK